MVTAKYMEAAGEGPLRDVMTEAEYPPVFAEAWGRYLATRPLLSSETRTRQAADDLAGLFRLMASLPDRLFDGDRRRFCAAVGADARRTDLMTRFDAEPILYGRADLYDDGSRFRLLEFNIGSELGGVDMSEANRCLLAHKEFAAFADEHGLSTVDTPAAIARQFVQATQKEAPVVATLEAVDGMAAYESLHRSFQESMKRYGIELLIGEVDQVQEKDGRLYLHDRPLDLVLRYFSAHQVARDPRNDKPVEAVMRAYEEGKVVLWTPLTASMFSYKSCLPLVSDPDMRAELSPDENALIDRILPWTRTLTPDLADQVRAERDELILKPVAGLSGRGIRVGWEQTDREWAETVAGCLKEDYIVQRRVVPAAEPMLNDETGAVEDWLGVWGLFVFPDGYGGAFCRAVPSGGASVVNLGTKGARVTSAFHY
ncbi:hypothetical protein BJY14_004216 [Actinomadura luteofluorescens]|uniref:Circularly permuted type 2 ATP-grasp protein n=1 Tax=Actinomadura luteofluorescens TaxID=46163 RepID=A0A7Y9JH44_9ACTN|nr:hypothetical protein [Actinomadura luteofluorescens]NYD48233.1 hypothetical protein [Actinomadura luteofluorescens]